MALKDPQVFHLFRHYKDSLASWYDLNDRQRHFTDIVPVKARYSPLLLSSLLAFSAISLHNSSGSESWVDQAEFYHLESVQILLRVTSNIEAVVADGEVLAAICLLRSFEIISGMLIFFLHLDVIVLIVFLWSRKSRLSESSSRVLFHASQHLNPPRFTV